MNIIQNNRFEVKGIIAGGFLPDGEDRSSAGEQLRAPRQARQGEAHRLFCSILEHPDGFRAQNSTNELGSMPNSFELPTLLDTCKQLGISVAGAVPVPIRVEDPDWKENRARLLEAQERIAVVLDEAGRCDEASKVRGCCQEFRVYKALCCGDTLAFPCSCGHRLCPVCMQRRSAVLSDRILNEILPGMDHPVHIILTVKNVSQINKEFFSWLRSCFTKLRHREIFENVIGGGYSIETTYNDEAKTWHVHLHVLADVGWISQQELSEEWKDITGSPVVWIKAVGYGKDQAPEDAAKEIAKYVVKPGEFLDDPALVDEYLKAVKRMRLWQTFGASLGVKPEDEGFEWPDCWCGENSWHPVGFFPLAVIFKDEEGYYRRRSDWRESVSRAP